MEIERQKPSLSPCSIISKASKYTGRLIAAFVIVICLVIFTVNYLIPERFCYIPTDENYDVQVSSMEKSENKGPNWYKYRSYAVKDDTNICAEMIYNAAEKEIVNSVNLKVNPCDNFYEFACQGWIDRNPKPSDMPKWSAFDKLKKRTIEAVVDILKQPSKSDDISSLDQAKSFMKSCMGIGNSKTWNYAMTVMWTTLEDYGGWPMVYSEGTWNSSKFNFTKSLNGLREKFATSVLINIRVQQSIKETKQDNKIILKPAPMFLGPIDLPAESSLKEFIGNVATELQRSQNKGTISKTKVENRAIEIFKVHNSLFAIWKNITVDDSMKKIKKRYGFFGNQKDTVLSTLQNMIDDFVQPIQNKVNLGHILGHLFRAFSPSKEIKDDESIHVSDVNYLLAISKVISEVQDETLANYLHFIMVYKIAPLTNAKMYGFWENLHHKLDGTFGTKDKVQFCAGITHQKFSSVIDHVYAKEGYYKSFSSDADIKEVKLISFNIGTTLADLIATSTIKGFKKSDFLSSVVEAVNCTNPEWIYSGNDVQNKYKNLWIFHTTFLQQFMSVNQLLLNNELGKIQLVDSESLSNSDKCKMHHPWLRNDEFEDDLERYWNDIPLHIPQAPVFESQLPRALNYGRLGSIIGFKFASEIIDTIWPEIVINESLSTSADCLVRQFNQYTIKELIYDNLTINGRMTLKENMKDHMGIIAAYLALRRFSLVERTEYKTPKGMEIFNQDQLFFLGFAQNWCATSSVQSMRNTIKGGYHVPNMFRVFGTLQNSNEFANAWQCPRKSFMNPDVTQHKKCVIL